MRQYRLQHEGTDQWKIFLGPNELASFTSQKIQELKALQSYLVALYPEKGMANMIINLPYEEVERPCKSNRSNNPADPNNDWIYEEASEEVMEAALYRLVSSHQSEFEQCCQDAYEESYRD